MSHLKNLAMQTPPPVTQSPGLQEPALSPLQLLPQVTSSHPPVTTQELPHPAPSPPNEWPYWPPLRFLKAMSPSLCTKNSMAIDRPFPTHTPMVLMFMYALSKLFSTLATSKLSPSLPSDHASPIFSGLLTRVPLSPKSNPPPYLFYTCQVGTCHLPTLGVGPQILPVTHAWPDSLVSLLYPLTTIFPLMP